MKILLCLRRLFFLLLLPLSIVGQVHANSPESVDGTKIIDAEQLLELVNEHPNMALVDARMPTDRKHGYIEGSINLPNYETSCLTLSELAPSLEAPIAFYCNGVKCGRSANSAGIAVECGYRSVYWFRGGIEEWKQRHYPLLR